MLWPMCEILLKNKNKYQKYYKNKKIYYVDCGGGGVPNRFLFYS